jgi:hypothetical protein
MRGSPTSIYRTQVHWLPATGTILYTHAGATQAWGQSSVQSAEALHCIVINSNMLQCIIDMTYFILGLTCHRTYACKSLNPCYCLAAFMRPAVCYYTS